jgi:hypothetical protein
MASTQQPQILDAEKPSAKDKASELVRIVIHKSPLPHAVDPVPVSVNGRQWTIKRGEVVEVPRFLVEVLEHAEETHFDQIGNPDGSTNLLERKSLSYPFSYA